MGNATLKPGRPIRGRLRLRLLINGVPSPVEFYARRQEVTPALILSLARSVDGDRSQNYETLDDLLPERRHVQQEQPVVE